MRTHYFKTYGEALTVSKRIPDSLCVNSYQFANETKTAKINEFGKGFAIQFGDCGDYVTNEFLKGLNQ
jgi:hypothetical protein